MKLSLIVAISTNGVIGRGGTLPWHLPADLKRFKQLTWGHAIIMGRKTYESIGRPLPGRTSIVVTRRADLPLGPNLRTASSLAEALALAEGSGEAFVIGGAQLYAAALPIADRLYLTIVQSDVEGDTFFPDWDESAWQLIDESWQAADERNRYPCHFQVFERLPPRPVNSASYDAR